MTGAYRLSRRLLDIAVAGSDEYSLASVAWPDMCALRDETNLTVQLGIITTDGRGLIIESVASRNPIRYVEEKGVWTKDLNTGAGWKSILAFLPKEESSRLVGALPFHRFTANTITSRKELEKALADVRKHGYAVDRAEGREGLHCVAAPIFDRTGRVIGTIGVSAPSGQLPERDFKRRAASTVVVASAISAKLGWNNNISNQRKEYDDEVP
ncbi:MAG: IclR family transcriptional regulator [Kiritimatiellae bacterium]|nr:IclR family transcriptional regulator [Kiritimatiellia bacterium]